MKPFLKRLFSASVFAGSALVIVNHNVAAETIKKPLFNFKSVQRSTKAAGSSSKKQFHFAAPLKLKMVDMKRLNPITSEKKEPKGADPQRYISLRDLLEAKDTLLLEDIDKIASWNSNLIFQDKEATHVFYYVPKEFRLILNENGYSLGVQYNSAQNSDEPTIVFTADLSAANNSVANSSGDIVLLKGILRNALGIKEGDTLEVKSIAGTGATLDFSAVTAGLAIPAERISAVVPAHMSDDLRIVVSLKPDEAEAFLTQVAHEGLSGTVKIPLGETTVDIGFNVQFAGFSGEVTREFQKWWLQGENIKTLTNISPFPLTVKAINAYVIEKGNLKRVSKKIGNDVVIEPGEAKKFSITAATKVIGSEIVTAWLDADLQTDCDKCIAKIREQVNRGISAAPTTTITFEAIPQIFEDYELYKLVVQVKSPYFFADSKKVTAKEIELSEENAQTSLNIFFPEGKGDNPLLFKYRIKLIKADGQTLASGEWQKSTEKSLMIGSYQLKQLFQLEE